MSSIQQNLSAFIFLFFLRTFHPSLCSKNYHETKNADDFIHFPLILPAIIFATKFIITTMKRLFLCWKNRKNPKMLNENNKCQLHPFFTQFPPKKDRIAEKNCFRDKKGAKRLSTKPIVTVNRNERKTRKKGVDLWSQSQNYALVIFLLSTGN